MPVRPRSYASNVGLRSALSNTLRLSPMPGAVLSTTLLDPLQRPGACNNSKSHAIASMLVAPARFEKPATTIGWKTSTTEQLQRDSCAKYAGPRRQPNVNSSTTRTVKRVAKVRGLSSHTLVTEGKGKFSHVRSVRINSRPYYKRAHSLRPSEKGGANKDNHLYSFSC